MTYIVNLIYFKDFNWFDNAFDILFEIYPKGIKKIDNEINFILNFHYRQENSEQEYFRRCLIIYIEKLQGYEHDDFDYSRVKLINFRSILSFVIK